MGTMITLYSLAWDTEGGCGCEIFATSEKRDSAFREALMSYVNIHTPVGGGSYDLAAMDVHDLALLLDEKDRLRGARYTVETHSIDITDATRA